MSARWTTDTEVLRLRHGTIPHPTRTGKRRFTLHGSLAVFAWIAGFVVGAWWG